MNRAASTIRVVDGATMNTMALGAAFPENIGTVSFSVTYSFLLFLNKECLGQFYSLYDVTSQCPEPGPFLNSSEDSIDDETSNSGTGDGWFSSLSQEEKENYQKYIKERVKRIQEEERNLELKIDSMERIHSLFLAMLQSYL